MGCGVVSFRGLSFLGIGQCPWRRQYDGEVAVDASFQVPSVQVLTWARWVIAERVRPGEFRACFLYRCEEGYMSWYWIFRSWVSPVGRPGVERHRVEVGVVADRAEVCYFHVFDVDVIRAPVVAFRGEERTAPIVSRAFCRVAVGAGVLASRALRRRDRVGTFV